MPCSRKMIGCKTDCLHRRFVQSYREERERQETARENQTALEFDEFNLITFQQFLVANKDFQRC